jgi:integrase
MGVKKVGKNKWQVIARIRINGNIAHKQQTIEGSKEAAKSLLEKFKQELRGNNKETSLSEIKTFSDVLCIYREKRGPFSKSYGLAIDSLGKEFGDVPLPSFPDRFELFIQLLKSSKSRLGKMYSEAAINRPIATTRAAFEICVTLGLIKTNPITKARFPKLKEIPRDMVLSDTEHQRLLKTVEKEAPHLSAMISFALQVPCRKSELVNMRCEDLDLINRAIRVRNGTTKNDTGTWKPSPPNMMNYFRNLPSESNYLFFRKDKNGYHSLGDFKAAWKRVRKLAGLEYFRFHDTRHVSATKLVDSGTPEQVVMSVAGWRTNMLRTYYHREPKKALELVRFQNDPEKM